MNIYLLLELQSFYAAASHVHTFTKERERERRM